jgi:iron complex transport system ATP-binding protein
MSRPEVALEIAGLGLAIKRTRLLESIDLSVAAGEWVSIIGPNGAGKSTLLRAIAGVAKSDGTVRVHGQSFRDLDRRERARLVSWVPQSPEIPAGIRVFDYVLLGRTPHLHPLAKEGTRDIGIVSEVLSELDLTELADRDVATLSGGELQRCVIGRSLVQQSPIMLLDEPTSALDLGHQQEVLSLLDRLRSNGDRSVITTMHDLTLAGAYADRLVMLADGRVVAHGTAAEVLTAERIEQWYGARVTVTERNGQVLVTPELAIVDSAGATGNAGRV